MQNRARAHWASVSSGQVPYNALAGASVGPGGSGKTQTHRSVMGKPFVSGQARESTVGIDREVLELRPNRKETFDLQPAETMSMLERAARFAAKWDLETEVTVEATTVLTALHDMNSLVSTCAGHVQVCASSWFVRYALPTEWRCTGPDTGGYFA
jgi:hypothetical protein